MAMSAEYRSKFAAIHWQLWRLHMSEKFSSRTKNRKQTNKQTNKQFTVILLIQSINVGYAQSLLY